VGLGDLPPRLWYQPRKSSKAPSTLPDWIFISISQLTFSAHWHRSFLKDCQIALLSEWITSLGCRHRTAKAHLSIKFEVVIKIHDRSLCFWGSGRHLFCFSNVENVHHFH
jgi:hypothetical protein